MDMKRPKSTANIDLLSTYRYQRGLFDFFVDGEGGWHVTDISLNMVVE